MLFWGLFWFEFKSTKVWLISVIFTSLISLFGCVGFAGSYPTGLSTMGLIAVVLEYKLSMLLMLLNGYDTPFQSGSLESNGRIALLSIN